MKAAINLLAVSVLSFLFTSCYTLNTHQSGKTLGKGNVSIQAIGGLSGFPYEENDPNNAVSVGASAPQLQAALGVNERVDIGVTFGFNKLGGLAKFQFIGNQESKFAMSSGAYYYKSFGTPYDYFDMVALEVPLFISYHPNKFMAIYSNPMLNYFSVESEGLVSIIDETFYATGAYKGLSSGFLFTIPVGSDKIEMVTSLDVSWLSPLESNRYLFFTTIGIGLKVKTGWFPK